MVTILSTKKILPKSSPRYIASAPLDQTSQMTLYNLYELAEVLNEFTPLIHDMQRMNKGLQAASDTGRGTTSTPSLMQIERG